MAAIFILKSGAELRAQPAWSVAFQGLGTFSSPRIADLNGDGTGDVILGAGREEFKSCDSAVIALDGKTGKMLWHVAAKDQVFGSPSFMDINGDNVEDVFISGRSSELFAINGRTGDLLWKFNKKQGKQKWYNFYNPQFIRDQDKDGLKDILISNGGNVMAEPYGNKKRYPGYLVILSSRDGSVLAHAAMPDKKETYMSVSALPIDDGNDYHVIFGTGGETIGGNLFVTTLSSILKGDLTNAKLLDSSPDKGYIGPAAWVDITGDSFPDIIANAVEGKLLAFNGKTHDLIWSVKVPNSEAYSSIAPGLFTSDNTPDFFVSYAIGQWPKLEWSKQVMVDGASGKIAYMDSLGFYQTSTPVVIDLDGNGRDEALLSVNIHIYDEKNKRALYNMIVSLDFNTGLVDQFTEPLKGSNISSTPWIGDMDNDNFLDIVYCHGTNTEKTYTFDGMQVNRIATKIPIKGNIKWGSYMGTGYDGVYDSSQSTVESPR
ncbi:MAG: PQQ-binding-like beta-propeller repeat protein [Cyclobacteriaceae bacterium]